MAWFAWIVFFAGFEEWDREVAAGVRVHGRSGGSGPAVALLHGHPRAHTTWYLVAPQLAAAGFSVVCPDLRGYGRSSKPDADPDHEVYCDRSMAADLVELMSQLGHERFSVVGHDRGQGVASRCALDHADRVIRLAILDGIPISEAVDRVDARFAAEWWHWFFFASSPQAERVITADADAWYGLDESKEAAMGSDNFAYVAAALRDPRTVKAMLEDYRAGLSIDDQHSRADRAEGRSIVCPTLVAWSVHDDMESLYGEPDAIWRSWVTGSMTTARIDSGHHMAEDNPNQLASVLIDHLATGGSAVPRP